MSIQSKPMPGKLLLSLEQIAELSINRLLDQGVAAARGASCRYFIEETGNRCAVGVLLPPEVVKFFTHTTWGVRGAAVRAREDVETHYSTITKEEAKTFFEALASQGIDYQQPGVLDLLGRLQSCHDSNFPRQLVGALHPYKKWVDSLQHELSKFNGTDPARDLWDSLSEATRKRLAQLT